MAAAGVVGAAAAAGVVGEGVLLVVVAGGSGAFVEFVRSCVEARGMPTCTGRRRAKGSRPCNKGRSGRINRGGYISA